MSNKVKKMVASILTVSLAANIAPAAVFATSFGSDVSSAVVSAF